MTASERFVLGVYFGYHDSSVAVAAASGVVLHLEAERALGRKHHRATADEMHELIDLALTAASLAPDGCQGVALCVSGNRFAFDEIEIGGRRMQAELVSHHEAHIGCIASSRDDMVVVCSDGGSEDGFGAVYWKRPQRRPVRLQRLDDKLANGRTYGAVAQLLIEPDWIAANLDGGGKLLGLSGYGTVDDGLVGAFQDSVGALNGASGSTALLESIFGSDVRHHPTPHTDERCAGLAASFQRAWTDDLLATAARWRHLASHIAITGGCAQNVRANAEVAHSGLFDSTTVPFAPTDAGASIGAVVSTFNVPAPTSPFLGRDYGFRIGDNTVLAISKDLIADRTVAVYEGASESGPRALGHRSVLASGRDPEARVRLSECIKNREPYRPIAPAVIASEMDRYFLLPPGTTSAYMSYAWSATEAFRAVAPAAVHVDGTSRPQAVDRGTHPTLWKILHALAAQGHSPAVLNTSMNVAGKPMADTPDNAREFFEVSGVDVLYIGDDRYTR